MRKIFDITPNKSAVYFYLIVSLVLLLIAFLGVFKIGYNVGLEERERQATPVPTFTPTVARRPLDIHYSLNDSYDDSGCFGKVTVLYPLPMRDKEFVGKFDYIILDTSFMGDGYRYLVSANPLWGCAAMKEAIEESQR